MAPDLGVADSHPRCCTLSSKAFLVHAVGQGLMKSTEALDLRGDSEIPGPATLSPPMLHLKILSIEITNRISDKGQTMWTPTSNGNLFDFQPKSQS